MSLQVLKLLSPLVKHVLIFLNIAGEYKELIGENIPYRALGHGSLEEFLDYGHDFCRIARSRDGSYVIHGIATAENSHITRMVSAQRSTSKKKSRPKSAPMRRPMDLRRWDPPHQSGGGAGGRGQFKQHRGRLRDHLHITSKTYRHRRFIAATSTFSWSCTNVSMKLRNKKLIFIFWKKGEWYISLKNMLVANFFKIKKCLTWLLSKLHRISCGHARIFSMKLWWLPL